ncbi:MAG: hypothetical protein RR902_01515, partial [Oscillospiraceae bacterium]
MENNSFENNSQNNNFNDEYSSASSLVYGKNAVTEMLKSGAAVDTIFISE